MYVNFILESRMTQFNSTSLHNIAVPTIANGNRLNETHTTSGLSGDHATTAIFVLHSKKAKIRAFALEVDLCVLDDSDRDPVACLQSF